MVKYFVVFHAEDDDYFPRNDVIEYHKEINDIQDIRNIEEIISNSWFSDYRNVGLINFKKI
jgi:hypothetical protein